MFVFPSVETQYTQLLYYAQNQGMTNAHCIYKLAQKLKCHFPHPFSFFLPILFHVFIL